MVFIYLFIHSIYSFISLIIYYVIIDLMKLLFDEVIMMLLNKIILPDEANPLNGLTRCKYFDEE